MKPAAFSLLLLFAAALNAHAGFRLPSGGYAMDELDQATERSKSRGVPITFLISDTETQCGLCVSAREEIIRMVIILFAHKNHTTDEHRARVI